MIPQLLLPALLCTALPDLAADLLLPSLGCWSLVWGFVCSPSGWNIPNNIFGNRGLGMVVSFHLNARGPYSSGYVSSGQGCNGSCGEAAEMHWTIWHGWWLGGCILGHWGITRTLLPQDSELSFFNLGDFYAVTATTVPVPVLARCATPPLGTRVPTWRCGLPGQQGGCSREQSSTL